MFQIVFNDLSAAETSALPKSPQLDLLAEFQILPEDLDRLDLKRFGVIEREGKKSFVIARKITGSISTNGRKGSPFTASCTKIVSRFSFREQTADGRRRSTGQDTRVLEVDRAGRAHAQSLTCR